MHTRRKLEHTKPCHPRQILSWVQWPWDWLLSRTARNREPTTDRRVNRPRLHCWNPRIKTAQDWACAPCVHCLLRCVWHSSNVLEAVFEDVQSEVSIIDLALSQQGQGLEKALEPVDELRPVHHLLPDANASIVERSLLGLVVQLLEVASVFQFEVVVLDIVDHGLSGLVCRVQKLPLDDQVKLCRVLSVIS